jgi:hypothetical protein
VKLPEIKKKRIAGNPIQYYYEPVEITTRNWNLNKRQGNTIQTTWKTKKHWKSRRSKSGIKMGDQKHIQNPKSRLMN